MDELIETLKEISRNEYNNRGCTGVIRFYYGKKHVVEWGGDGFDLFWKVWRERKEELKKLGFGVWKDKKWDRFVIFRDVEYIRRELPETHPHHPDYEFNSS